MYFHTPIQEKKTSILSAACETKIYDSNQTERNVEDNQNIDVFVCKAD